MTQYHVDLRTRLLTTFTQPDYCPPVLPAVAVELVRLAKKVDVSVADIGQVLERDPVLTADVLRVAQSAAYATRGDIRSIQQAIVRIGLARAADLFVRVALETRIFRAPGYAHTLEVLRRHSIATAEVARVICRHTNHDDEYAYVCGLLHDVGIAGAILAITDTRVTDGPEPFEDIWPALSSVHSQFTVQLAQLWGLPEQLRTILRHHHTYAVEPAPVTMATVTILAEVLAAQVGYEFYGEESTGAVDKAMAALQLTPDDLEAIAREARQAIAQCVG